MKIKITILLFLAMSMRAFSDNVDGDTVKIMHIRILSCHKSTRHRQVPSEEGMYVNHDTTWNKTYPTLWLIKYKDVAEEGYYIQGYDSSANKLFMEFYSQPFTVGKIYHIVYFSSADTYIPLEGAAYDKFLEWYKKRYSK